MNNDILPVWVGYDSREDIAYRVCEFSIRKHCPSAEIKPLKQTQLRQEGLYTRGVDNLGSTEFTFTRFLVPALQHYNGWALFCDCDFVWDGDISELFAQANPKYAVMVVKHDHQPTNTEKMDGKVQSQYPRKNWSSCILWNCSHPSNKKLTIEEVNSQPGSFLHRFQWLSDSEIGELHPKYNFLVGWNKEEKDGKPVAYHWTEGGPWFENYANCPYNHVWVKYLIEYADEIGRDNNYTSAPITFVTTLSRAYFDIIGNLTLPTWRDLPGEVVFVWDDKAIDLGFGSTFNFWRDVSPQNDPWLTEGLGGAKADRFWKKSRVQAWAARKFKGLVVWLDADISLDKPLPKSKAINLFHPGNCAWATLDPGEPADLESGVVTFNTRHPDCSNTVRDYARGWYNGDVHKLRQPYDNFMIRHLRDKHPYKSYCSNHGTWNIVDTSKPVNVWSIKNSPLGEYFTHHIGIGNKEEMHRKNR